MSTIIKPRADWQNYDACPNIFPDLIYELKPWNDAELLGYTNARGRSMNNKSDDFMMGGSWNLWAREPMYPERCAMFENLHFPYDHSFKYLTVRNAAILWPNINVYLYTSLRVPSTVFLTNHLLARKIIAKFELGKNRIALTEYE